jgi:YidC/Oxa1 family membrane protein insertase
MSYFLIIRWDPPVEESTLIDYKPEVSTNLPSEDFGFIDDSMASEETVIDKTEFAFNCNDAEYYEINSNTWMIQMNLKDGSIDKSELKKYPNEINSDDNKLMFDACGKNEYSQASGFVFNKQQEEVFSSFKVKDISRNNETNIYTFARVTKNLEETKIISFDADSYFVNIKHVIKNLSPEKFKVSAFSKLERNSLKPPGTEGAFFGDPANFAYLGPVFSTESDNYQKISLGDLEDEDFRDNSVTGWTAFLEHYFLTAIIPNQKDIHVFVGKKNKTNERFSAGIVSRPMTVDSFETGSFDYSLYFGPKIQSELSKANSNLPLAVDYGFLYWIGQPMFLAMQFFYNLVGNWGWAIILVTLLIKVILWPLSYVSYKSMGKMRQIQPQMKDLQERHSGDRQAMSQAMMKLYKDEKVNPALGCLPMLLQMPFFLAFYWVLIETVELRYAPFLIWITDLSSRDPLFILPILNIGAMWAMQLLQPQPAGIDPMQAKIFKFMPLIFGVMFAFFPAGLVLYWLMNSVVSAIQMLLHSPRSA